MTVVLLSWFWWLGWSWFCWLGQSHLHLIGGQSIHGNIFIHKGDHWLHCLVKLHYTLHNMARLTRNHQLSLLHPVLESLGICKGLLWLHELVVSTAKSWVWRWHGPVSLHGWVGWWCRAVVVYPHCMISFLRQFKWHLHFLSKFPVVMVTMLYMMTNALTKFLCIHLMIVLLSVSL